MSVQTEAQLVATGDTVKTNTGKKTNTHTLIGQFFEDIANTLFDRFNYLDGYLAQVDGRFKLTKNPILTADLLSAFTTPVTLITAPGAGKAIEVISFSDKLNFNTTAFATNTLLDIKYDGGAVLTTIDISGAATVHKRRNLPDAIILPENTALIAQLQTGDATAGDGSLDIHMVYRVITV